MLQRDIFSAFMIYEVRMALWETPEEVDMLNRHKDFFEPVRRGLYTAMFIGFAKIFDSDRRTVSLHNLLIDASDDPQELVPRLNPSEINTLQQTLAGHGPVKEALSNTEIRIWHTQMPIPTLGYL